MFDALEPLTPEQVDRDWATASSRSATRSTHLYAAEWAWYSRWQGTSPTALLPADTFRRSRRRARAPGPSTRRRCARSSRSSARRASTRVFEYKLLSGQPGASPFWQMLQHVVNHASYHRGQVTTMLRQLGAQPAKSLDMIAFYRTRG